jgi:hypothetical protein
METPIAYSTSVEYAIKQYSTNVELSNEERRHALVAKPLRETLTELLNKARRLAPEQRQLSAHRF